MLGTAAPSLGPLSVITSTFLVGLELLALTSMACRRLSTKLALTAGKNQRIYRTDGENHRKNEMCETAGCNHRGVNTDFRRVNTSRAHGKLLLLFGLWVRIPAEDSRCCSRHCFLALCLMVRRHLRHVSIVPINPSAKLVEPSLLCGFSLHACGRCALGTPAPLSHGHSSRHSYPRASMFVVAALVVHSCLDPLAVLIAHSCHDPLPSWTCGSLRCTHRRGRIGRFTSRVPLASSFR